MCRNLHEIDQDLPKYRTYMAWNQWKDSGEQKEQDQRSQRLTLRELNCDKTRGIKVDTKTQKFKSQHVSLAK